MVHGERSEQFTNKPLTKRRIGHVPVIAPFEDFNHRIASKFIKRLFEQANRSFQVERIFLAGKDPQLARKLRFERRLIFFEYDSDVVFPPGSRYGGIHFASLSVVQRQRFAIRSTRTEHGLEGM